MKNVRLVATVLFYLTRLLAVLYLVTIAYAAIILLISQTNEIWIDLEETGRFTIFYPFTESPFLLGEFSTTFFTEMFLGMGAYGVFFWLLSDVFSAFRNQKLFTASSVRKLSRFYIANLTVPIMVLILLSILTDGQNVMVTITVLHFVIGIFAYFMASIFNHGVVLQEEQDLTI